MVQNPPNSYYSMVGIAGVFEPTLLMMYTALSSVAVVSNLRAGPATVCTQVRSPAQIVVDSCVSVS
eukprot:SAG22_NODE_1671_length_3847_cov_7.686766_3_plen_66_part_00